MNIPFWYTFVSKYPFWTYVLAPRMKISLGLLWSTNSLELPSRQKVNRLKFVKISQLGLVASLDPSNKWQSDSRHKTREMIWSKITVNIAVESGLDDFDRCLRWLNRLWERSSYFFKHYRRLSKCNDGVRLCGIRKVRNRCSANYWKDWSENLFFCWIHRVHPFEDCGVACKKSKHVKAGWIGCLWLLRVWRALASHEWLMASHCESSIADGPGPSRKDIDPCESVLRAMLDVLWMKVLLPW
jgi:hypothetical protein